MTEGRSRFSLIGLLICWVGLATAHADENITIVYLHQNEPIPPALSNLDEIPRDRGVQGVRLGLEDNNTTGKFLNQHYEIKEVIVPVEGDVTSAFADLLNQGYRYFITDINASPLKKITNQATEQGALLFDIRTTDDELRNRFCDTTLFHIQPSRAMRADALGQFALKKRWKKLFLVTGPNLADRLYAAAIKRTAKRMNLKIVEEKTWNHTHDARRTAQSEVPVFTQGIDYDLLVVADESDMFGEYLIYRTWTPRLVIGTQGLVATSWHRTHEQWGAVQLQNRFLEQANRWMEERDYAGWLAVRALGEAVTRTNTSEPKAILSYLLGEKFSLAGFKGKPLSFRPWNGQLRQPVLLAAPRSMVAVTPYDGFLHPRNELDTLGYDKPEMKCE